VFGRRAGIAAAGFAAEQQGRPPRAVLAQADDERRRLERDLLTRRDGRERIADIRTDMQHTMEGSAGIFRDVESLVTGAEKLRELRERFAKAVVEDDSRTFNTELVAALELDFMLDVAETIVACALRREESRGAHQRTDFPRRDDERFLAHSVVTRGPTGSPHVEYRPVTITRWPPGERVYGR
jgi:fumarate reductase flavoprotein subunit